MSQYQKAAQLLKESNHAIAFTDAGISVESGLKPFRGENGLWVADVNPELLSFAMFMRDPGKSIQLQKKFLFEPCVHASPNAAHAAIAGLEESGFIKAAITQNIDNLHHKAGSKNVLELHGNIREAVCLSCDIFYPFQADSEEAPQCEKCNAILKPNCILFGERLPKQAWYSAEVEMRKADVLLLVGASGIVEPAGNLPFHHCQHLKMININPSTNRYAGISDVNIEVQAGIAMTAIARYL